MKRFCRYIPLFVLLFSIRFAYAQSAVDFGVGFGTAFDKSTGMGIENLSSVNAFGACTPASSDPTCQTTPSLNSFFMGIGADIMLYKHLGVGGEGLFQPAKRDYGPLTFRETFYDFNAIYAPVNEKKFVLKLAGGVGGAKTGFSYTQSGCVGTAVCSTSTQPVGSSNHFALHVGLGAQIYVTEHVFLRPQFDFRYVPNLTQQFGSNAVPGFTFWVGYSLGDR